jgi:protein-tyrosine phosphatase
MATDEGSIDRGPGPDHSRFDVLFLCTANVCRSPLAEHLLRHDLEVRLGPGEASRWRVHSAGTRASAGAPMHELVRQVLAERDITVGDGVARRVDAPMIEAADLVLTASRDQRAAAVGLVPSSVRRVFTLRQFARLCTAGRNAPGAPATAAGPDLIDVANLGRPLVAPGTATEDAIADPMGLDLEAFQRCAQVTAGSIDAMLSALSVLR